MFLNKLVLPITIFLLSWSAIFADAGVCKTSKQEEKVPSGFLFSEALIQFHKSLAYLNRQSKEKEASLKEALENIQAYLDCDGDPQSIAYATKSSILAELGKTDEALQAIDQSIQKNPSLVELRLQKARILARQGRVAQSVDFLEKDLSTFHNNSDYVFLLASYNFDLRRYNKAMLYYTSLLESILYRQGDPKYKPFILKILGDIYYTREDYKRSNFYYQSFLLDFPNDLDVLFRNAHSLYQVGEFARSKKILQGILEKNPNNKEVELLLGELYFLESDSESFEVFQKLDREKKLDKDSIFQGLYFTSKSKYSNAIPILENWMQKQPGRLSARVALIKCFQETKYKSRLKKELVDSVDLSNRYRQFYLSEKYLQKLLREFELSNEEKLKFSIILAQVYAERGSPNRGILTLQESEKFASGQTDLEKIQLELANIYLNDSLKRYEKSQEILQSVLSKNPGNANAHFLNGFANFLMKKYPEAIESYQKTISIEPQNPNFYFYLALSEEKNGDVPKALQHMKKAIELNPANSVYHNSYGYLLLENQRDSNVALSHIQKAIDLEPDNASYQDSLGYAYFKLERYPEALYHLRLSQELFHSRGMEEPVVYEHLGDVYFAKNDLTNAKFHWKKALDLTSDEKEKEKIRKKMKKMGDSK